MNRKLNDVRHFYINDCPHIIVYFSPNYDLSDGLYLCRLRVEYIKTIIEGMSISRDQSTLLASCHSQKDIEYLEAVLRTSIDKTPLKQISGICEDENPEK